MEGVCHINSVQPTKLVFGTAIHPVFKEIALLFLVETPHYENCPFMFGFLTQHMYASSDIVSLNMMV
jgi:hypothetical protein